ncbi:putative Carbonic anhydrase 6 [Hypsibius exemplaris]|uniref:Carbonic anhydrase n=1 Tax=Hypsibius exemplaris TaxID=2072580 RepID=A0A1W0XEJ0_HYPEX|nr:putative Carbonic anhydrase 6 [Hypsibius exemplaris]
MAHRMQFFLLAYLVVHGNGQHNEQRTNSRILNRVVVTVPRSATNAPPQHSPVHWTYERDTDDSEVTAADWSRIYPACSGRRQSPLPINTTLAQRDPMLKSLTLIDYDDTPVDDLWSVINNGHAVQFSGFFRTPPQIHGTVMGKYIFQQMHFHWGSNSSVGSEHIINGKTYPLEVHMVHRRKNDTDEEAQKDDVGLAVLAVLFEVAKTREPPNRHMEDIIAAVRKVAIPGVAVNATLPYFALQELIPDNPSFYRYLGSLTTPPCSEVVVWSVMKESLKITETQLNVFRSLLKNLAQTANAQASAPVPVALGRDLLLLNNHRPIQPLFDRNVTFYEAPNDKNSILRPKNATTDDARPFNFNQRMQMSGADTTWQWPSTTAASSGAAAAQGRNPANIPRTSKFVLAVLFTVWLKSL